LRRALGVPAVLSCFSRLLIDPNRGEKDPTLIMQLSDGAVVPGNADITHARARPPAEHVSPALS
jgi:predicted N-formylglutamate amidohydrolase